MKTEESIQRTIRIALVMAIIMVLAGCAVLFGGEVGSWLGMEERKTNAFGQVSSIIGSLVMGAALTIAIQRRIASR